jgi:hypothetical protein
MGKKLIILISIAFAVISCAKECEVSTGKTVKIDLSALPLTGAFKGKDKDMEIKVSNDSVAIITFKENGNTYELTYKIDTIGQYYETYEQKYIN